MKALAKKLAALALSAALLTAPAGAVTADGQSETWFDGVWALINTFGLTAEDNPYILQNYINKYLEEHPEELYDVLNGILSTMDTHSMYLSAEEYSQGFSSVEGFVGIGVGIEQSANGVRIAEVMRYSAAEEAGLQIGDVITKVGDKDASQMGTADVAELLRGQEGTKLSLTVQRQGRSLTFTCTRRKINQTYVSNKTLAEGIEYIKVTAMGSENDWKAFEEIWNSLPDKGTKAVVLDLRGNGGGVIDVAIDMADAMVPEPDVYLAGVHWREDMGGLTRYYSTKSDIRMDKIVVLVDGGTASAAELLAGSLKETGSATLVGMKTYGKGQGQFHLELVNGDKLVITTLNLELPESGVYEGKGIQPDVTVENEKVTVDAKALKPLDTATPLYFGDSSDSVYAMTERLHLLGLLDGARQSFDGEVLDAVSAFRQTYEMAPAQYASPEMLVALEQAMRSLDGQTYELDSQLQLALEMCRLAVK